jgi:STE24 endopeptidase
VNEDKASRYHRLKRQAEIASLGLGIILLIALIATGASLGLRDVAEQVTAGTPSFLRETLAVVAFVALLTTLNAVLGLPLAFYGGWVIERRYGLSRQSISAWILDELKSLTLGLVLGSIAATIVYALIRRVGGQWWLPAGLVFALLVVGLANLGPVLLLPLFYRIKPLERESLRARLLALAERGGARVLGIYEWGLGEKTTKANAALAGVGVSRRILVSDTMLADYSEDEIEVVLAHELAHHVHGDIWKGLALESALILAGCFVASRVLDLGAALAGLRGPADVAGMPLLLLGAGGVSLLMLPLAHALSRANERSADRFALQLTRNPDAFVSAMKRLGAQNLAEEDPSKIVQILFYSHPPIRERIAAAQAFRT